jgi:hypothetical protein
MTKGNYEKNRHKLEIYIYYMALEFNEYSTLWFTGGLA